MISYGQNKYDSKTKHENGWGKGSHVTGYRNRDFSHPISGAVRGLDYHGPVLPLGKDNPVTFAVVNMVRECGLIGTGSHFTSTFRTSCTGRSQGGSSTHHSKTADPEIEAKFNLRRSLVIQLISDTQRPHLK
ncbi:hypothetical protein J6590_046631 [Homalodisca vitripennis]|nr:hypothetical protein J6590_046631 [Homalodisca vitripennis]